MPTTDNLLAQDEANEFDDNLLARRCARCKTPFRRERLANEGRNGEFDDNLLALRCARCKTSFRRERLANEGRNGEFDDKLRKARERKVCKVQDVISA